MCLTNSSELAEQLRILRDHGITPNRSYWHERVGFNYRITNLQRRSAIRSSGASTKRWHATRASPISTATR